jgi:hypothetical protein
MIIKPGNVVSHIGAHEWGVGKVVEVTKGKATIQFSDGKKRKIAASHYSSLQPADPASFSLPPETIQTGKAKMPLKTSKRRKQAVPATADKK